MTESQRPPRDEGSSGKGPGPDLLERTLKFLLESAGELVRKPIQKALRESGREVMRMLFAFLFFGTAAVFLLIAVLEGLKSAFPNHPFVPWTVCGALSLTAGALFLLMRPRD